MRKREIIFAIVVAIATVGANNANACTGITLKSKDGGVVVARTNEWAEFEMKNMCVVVPRNYSQKSLLPDGTAGGLEFTSTYGYVGLAAEMPEIIIDGTNEKGLSAGVFYFPNYGEYQKYNPENKGESLADFQVVSWILGNFATVDEVKNAIDSVHIINIDPRASTVHWRVAEPSGREIVIEIVDGKPQVYENTLGVLTNSPNFPWQIKNLNNYVNLMPGGVAPQKLGPLTLRAFGAGSGMLGLPGDMTPPSRFVRASFFQSYSIPQSTTYDAVRQAFHLMNNFDIPLGAQTNADITPPDMPSATQWTVATDLKNKIIYYHTMYNRTLRSVDLNKIDFASISYQHFPLDDNKQETIIPIQVK